MRSLSILFVVVGILAGCSNVRGAVLVREADAVPYRGVYEIALAAPRGDRNPYFDVDFRVLFIRPNETQVTVDGFYDGDATFRARAYSDTLGRWQWRSISNVAELDGRSGEFQVVPSELPGKLRQDPDDPHQLVYDNGQCAEAP